MAFKSKYTGPQVEGLLDQMASGCITVETDPIFSASPAFGITENNISEWNNKVDKVEGKQLSTEDFTTILKQKLEGLSNYDDAAINQALQGLQTQVNTIVSGNASTAIESFNEIVAFLDGITDSQDLDSIIASIEQQIAGKMDNITLAAVATSGSYNDLKDKPAIPEGTVIDSSLSTTSTNAVQNKVITTELSKKGTYSKPSGGIPKGDLSSEVQTSLNKANTALQEHQSLADYAKSADLAKVATSGSYNDLSNKPTIPSAVTESTVSGWGFTKNTGTYSKPSGGIPKSDLASAVQTSLGKADTALQSYTEQYKGTVTSVKVDNVSKSPSSGVVDLGYVNKKLTTSTSSSMALSPNIYYRNTSTSLSTLTITLGSVSNSNIINEYFVEFTTRSAGTTVSLPSTIKWANGETPTFEASTTYQISIVNNLGTIQKFK